MFEREIYVPGVIPKEPLIHWGVEQVTNYFIPEIHVSGFENLYKGRYLIANGCGIVFADNHLSNADGPIVDQTLRRNDFADIADKLIYIKGKKLDDNPLAAFLTNALPTIPVWPVSLVPQTEEEERKARKMNLASFEIAKRALREGYHLCLFPEGTRSRDQTLGLPVVQAVGYLNLVKNTFVIPVGIARSETILPIGATLPTRGSVYVNIGRPINISLLQEAIKDRLVKDEEIRSNPRFIKEETRRKTMIYIMKNIAELIPPMYRGERYVKEHEIPYRV